MTRRGDVKGSCVQQNNGHCIQQSTSKLYCNHTFNQVVYYLFPETGLTSSVVAGSLNETDLTLCRLFQFNSLVFYLILHWFSSQHCDFFIFNPH